MFLISIEKSFSAAHALRLPDGALEPLHGHDWAVCVTVASAQLDAMDTVCDFHDLEKSVQEILAPWHNRLLNEVSPFGSVGGDLAINPSAERVAQCIGRGLADALPAGVTLHEVAVGEAPGCTAIYRPL